MRKETLLKLSTILFSTSLFLTSCGGTYHDNADTFITGSLEVVSSFNIDNKTYVVYAPCSDTTSYIYTYEPLIGEYHNINSFTVQLNVNFEDHLSSYATNKTKIEDENNSLIKSETNSLIQNNSSYFVENYGYTINSSGKIGLFGNKTLQCDVSDNTEEDVEVALFIKYLRLTIVENNKNSNYNNYYSYFLPVECFVLAFNENKEIVQDIMTHEFVPFKTLNENYLLYANFN